MIKAVANFFAGVIGVFIILAVAAIVWGIYVAIGANMDQDAFMMGAGIAAVYIRRAMFYYLPKEDGKDHDDSDFWDLLSLRDRQRLAADP